MLELIIGLDSSGNEISKDLSDLGHLFVSYLEDKQIKKIAEHLLEVGSNEVGRVLIICKDSNLIDLRYYTFTESYLYNNPENGTIKNKKNLFISVKKEVRKQQKSKHTKSKKTLIWIDDMWQFYPKFTDKKSISDFRQLLQNGHLFNIHFIIGSILPYRNLLLQLMRNDPLGENRNLIAELGAELIYSPDELVFFRESNNDKQEIYYPIESNLSLVEVDE